MREAAAYRALSSSAGPDRLSGYVARLVSYDAGLHLLILELVPGASRPHCRCFMIRLESSDFNRPSSNTCLTRY